MHNRMQIYTLELQENAAIKIRGDCAVKRIAKQNLPDELHCPIPTTPKKYRDQILHKF